MHGAAILCLHGPAEALRRLHLRAMTTDTARQANLAGTGFHLATVSAAGAMEPLLAVISFTTSRHSERCPR